MAKNQDNGGYNVKGKVVKNANPQKAPVQGKLKKANPSGKKVTGQPPKYR